MRPCYRRRIRKKERSHLNTRRPTLSSPGSHSSLNDPALTVINQRVHARLHKAYIRGRDHGETGDLSFPRTAAGAPALHPPARD